MANRRTALVSARKSAGYTQESLAAALDVDRSTIIRWEAGDYAPLPYLRPKLGRLLRQSPEQLRDLIDGTAQAEPPLELNPDIDAACTWLDQQAGATPGSTRRQVRAVLQRSNKQELRDRRLRRAQVTRSEVTRALRTYYIDEQPPYELYTAHYGGQRLETTILTRPEWLDLRCPLVAASNGIRLSTNGIDAKSPCQLDITAATQRLAEAQTFDTRLTNDPLYRLIDADIEPGTIKATVGLAPFVEYALTMDLLEGEILDALADGRQVESGALPLRDRYLPTLDAVMDFPARLCVGGVLALLAIARPAGINGEPDYLFLVQVRSSHVVNAARQLAVIPKGFHQPLTDYHADSQLAHSLLRELEEELLGRSELDSTSRIARRSAQPMHPQRMSKPLQWLIQEPKRLQLECTGFGINLVSGNYEFACLAVVEDHEFWSRFGGLIEANWEASGLRMYSTADRHVVRSLLADESWSNEGLFAISEGLRCLV